MKRLIAKILLLMGIVTFICLILTHVVLPHFWARPEAQVKFDFWKQNIRNYNTVFIGSSRIYQHVKPLEFDSIARSNNVDVHSFNLGIPSFPFPQSTVMLNDVIAENPNLRYIYYEVAPVYVEIANELQNTPESYYWYDFQHTSLLCREIAARKQYTSGNKMRLMKQHLSAWLERNYLLGGAESIFSSSASESWTEGICINYAGYGSFENEMLYGPDAVACRNRRSTFEKDTSILVERRNSALNFLQSNKSAEATPYSLYLKELDEQSLAKGITIYYIIAPRLTQYEGLSELVSGLPPERVIDLSSPLKYPHFYEYRYAFDKGHLNGAGAHILTECLFELTLGQHHQ